jgi:hypothetical protein
MEVPRSFFFESPDSISILKSNGVMFETKSYKLDLSKPFPACQISSEFDLEKYKDLKWGVLTLREKGLTFLYFQDENMKKRLKTGKSPIMSEISSEIKYGVARKVIPFGGVLLAAAELGIATATKKSKLDIQGAIENQNSVFIPINEIHSFNCEVSKKGKRNSVLINIEWEKDESTIENITFYTEDKQFFRVHNGFSPLYFFKRFEFELQAAKQQALEEQLGDSLETWKNEFKTEVIKIKNQKGFDEKFKDVKNNFNERMKELMLDKDITNKVLLSEAVLKVKYWINYSNEPVFSSLPKLFEALSD